MPMKLFQITCQYAIITIVNHFLFYRLKLTRVPLLLLHNSVFLLHLPFLIFLSARKPPPQPPEPHFHCFFPVLLHHHHITVVFPPPPSFYCFHPSSSTTTTTTTTTFQCVFPPLPPHSNAYFSTNV